MKQQSPDTAAMLDALRRAVTDALERKRRLGHYAVTWDQGEIRLDGEDSPRAYGYPRAHPAREFWIEEDND
jgi:hypothetical protein